MKKRTGTNKLLIVYLKNGVICIVKYNMADEEDDGGDEEEAVYTTPFVSQVIC
jgi:hypothetical protein